MKKIFVTFLLFSATTLYAQKQDTLHITEMKAVEVVSTVKEGNNLRDLPLSFSSLDANKVNDNHITSMKGISTIVPNLFIPDYGSRLTSAVYIRGIGSRMNESAVGLYVDNMPYFDKSGFDFNLYDIERVDVLRGPQGTLYGRNTMGGIVKIYTRNPLYYQGTTLKVGYVSHENRRQASIIHYHRPSRKLAFSIGGYYNGTQGLFRNDITGQKVDWANIGGAKARLVYLPSERITLDFNASYEYTNEGAYPYYYIGPVSGDEHYPDYAGRITNNHENTYRRSLLNAGLKLDYSMKNVTMTSITSYQWLNDRMFLDQDFINADMYTLEQKQRINSLNEEITFHNTNESRWKWICGMNLMYQWLHTTGPVIFYGDGITVLENNINGVLPANPQMTLSFDDDNFEVGGTFDTPRFNIALFHQSTYHFTENFSATAGLRLDYERNSIGYNAPTTVQYSFSMPQMRVNLQNLRADIYEYNGSIANGYVRVLPKFAFKYQFNKDNNVYASITNGMRSGGYNVQMFSDILQGAMQKKMIDGVKEGVFAYLDENMPAMAPRLKPTIENALPKVEMPDVNGVAFKPEYSWNYELGAHLMTKDGKFVLDAAMFYIMTRDQQITRFTESGLGRQMVNAGKSRSFGVETSILYMPVKSLSLSANYGFTNAKFVEYDAGNDQDYSGNYIPFVPQHTLNIDAAYTWTLTSKWAKKLTLGATYNGAGRIYWTEANDASQGFYSLLGARLNLATSFGNIQVWGRNLTDSQYNTFYFQSSNRAYAQHCRPLQIGIDMTFVF